MVTGFGGVGFRRRLHSSRLRKPEPAPWHCQPQPVGSLIRKNVGNPWAHCASFLDSSTESGGHCGLSPTGLKQPTRPYSGSFFAAGLGVAWLGGAARAFPCLWSDLAGGDATQACGNSTRDCIVERAWATPSMDDNAWSLSCLPHTTGHDKAFET